MSSSVDITFFKPAEGLIKIGEIVVEQDGLIEGFLFENPDLLHNIETMPGSLSLSVVLNSEVQVDQQLAGLAHKQLCDIQDLLKAEGVNLLLHQIETILKVLQPKDRS